MIQVLGENFRFIYLIFHTIFFIPEYSSPSNTEILRWLMKPWGVVNKLQYILF